jgi:hypothetical protein
VTTLEELQRRADRLRDTTTVIRTVAGLLLLAPGFALAGAGLLGGLDGAAKTLAEWALITAVAMAAPIGAAIWPRRPDARRETRAEIIADAERRAVATPAAVEAQAAEVERLQEIVDAKWGWVQVAIVFGAIALALAAAAVIAQAY